MVQQDLTPEKNYYSHKSFNEYLLSSSGEELEADFIFTCVGNQTRTDLSSTTTALDLNEWGQVKVDSTDLHVIGEKSSKMIYD